MNQPQYPYQAPPPQKSNVVLILVIIGAVLGLLLLLAVGAGVMGYMGVKKYTAESKKAEGRATAGQIARGIIACMEREELTPSGKPRELPASSPAVPASIPRAAKYMSAPSDWSSPAFTCARFSMTMPQYFQYQWEKVSAERGVVHARADLDGDGVAEVNIEVEVRCSAEGDCNAGTLVEK